MRVELAGYDPKIFFLKWRGPELQNLAQSAGQQFPEGNKPFGTCQDAVLDANATVIRAVGIVADKHLMESCDGQSQLADLMALSSVYSVKRTLGETTHKNLLLATPPNLERSRG
ncbi:hypothetical protein AB5N19_08961 [Seiridium cardinale]